MNSTLLLTYDPAPPTSTEDDLHLASYEAKLQLVRDYTIGVARGFSNGFFLYGTGGIAKSYTVLGELQRLGVDFKLFNSRMSGRGLFEALAEYPAAVHVLEDMERVVKDKDAQGILRSACWGQRGEDGKQKRTISWVTARGVESIVFNGGIIMLSNRPLNDLPELRAIKTRISHLHLEVSDAEIAAQMRRLARNGYKHDGNEMSADECETVCDFVILESQSKLCHLDMRLLDNSFRDFLQWREGHSACHWQTLVATRLDGARMTWWSSRPKIASKTRICARWKPCWDSSPRPWQRRSNGVAKGARAGHRFSGTRERWKNGLPVRLRETSLDYRPRERWRRFSLFRTRRTRP